MKYTLPDYQIFQHLCLKHFALSSYVRVSKDPGILHVRRKHPVSFLCPLQYHNNRKNLQYLHIYLRGSKFQMNINRHTNVTSYNLKTSLKTMVFLCYVIAVRKPIFLFEALLLFVVFYPDSTDATNTNLDPSRKGSAIRKLYNDS